MRDVKPRVLIVGTVPYNEKSTSRAFDSYFHYWEKENLAQIFSNTKIPIKGHCSTLFQITDQRMLKRWMGKRIDTGKIFNYEQLPTEWKDNDLEVGSSVVSKLYGIGSKKNSLVYLARGVIWRKNLWCTDKLNKWLDNFQPECVFLSFSDDFFIPKIALYVAERFDIPIISSIGDDYYFNYDRTLSPFYHIYKRLYRNLIRKVLCHKGSAIYIGDKIRDKYNMEFGLNGKTVYLTSTIHRREFKVIDKVNPQISYFGNIRLGRNESLNEIGMALGQINKDYVLDVYSNESNPEFYKLFDSNPNVKFHGSVPYAEVQRKTVESDIVVVVEGFEKKYVDITRYSLSTKVADSLASGVSVLAYGSMECGAIEYAADTGCIATCVDKKNLVKVIHKLISEESYQRENYEKAIKITEMNHRLDNSTDIFESVVRSAIDHYRR